MPVLFHQVIQYYRSRDFARDYVSFVRHNPTAAALQLHLIVEQFNENLEPLGASPTAAEHAVQAHFVNGTMPIENMIALVRAYATTIEARWPS